MKRSKPARRGVVARPPGSLHGVAKRATGIAVFDELSGGGLPDGRVSIVIGAAGSGKTVFALQTVRNAAAQRGEVGIFVSFEERSDDLLRNADGFGWDLGPLIDDRLFLVDGRLPADVMQSGDADLSGLLAGVGALATQVAATWVVFDSLDAMIALLDDPRARRREIVRLHDWIEQAKLTCIVTAKRGGSAGHELTEQSPLSYLVDCVIDLETSMSESMALRALRIVKYRGSAHYNNSVPCRIGPTGFELVPVMPTLAEYQVFEDRLSTGVPEFDAMLGGGVLRGSAVLLTGAPGTAKTSISGRFVEALCQRGERALMVCFDEGPAEIVRNLRSIGIDLAPHLQAGRLRMSGIAARAESADLVFAALYALVLRDKPDCIVVDPVSALIKGGGELVALGALMRIFQLCKRRGITLVMPCLINKTDVDVESSEIHASTIADVWIHLSYLVRSGERNRLLTVVKARGTAHSNQVRELVLSKDGVHLAEPYTENGEVLTGTLRWQREQAMQRQRQEAARAAALAEQRAALGRAELEARIAALQHELQLQTLAGEALRSDTAQTEAMDATLLAGTRGRRGAAAPARRQGSTAGASAAKLPGRRGGGK